MHRNLLLCLLISPFQAWATSPFFGDKDIDYWQEGKTISSLSPREEIKKQKEKAKSEYWNHVLDPKNLEFWDEGGGYHAPEPIRKAAVSCYSKNKKECKKQVKLYIEWEEKKRKVMAAFMDEIDAHTSYQEMTSNYPGAQNSEVTNIKKATSDSKLFIPWQDVEIIYFYSSNCSACIANKTVIDTLQNLGVNIVFVSLDHEQNSLYPSSLSFDNSMKKDFDIKATPTAYIKIGNNKARIVGAKAIHEWIAVLTKLAQN